MFKSRCKTLLTEMEVCAHCLKRSTFLYHSNNNTVVKMIKERQLSKMVIPGSDLIAGHGSRQPVAEDTDL